MRRSLTTDCLVPEGWHHHESESRILPLVLTCCTLHIMRLGYPGIHQGIADEEDDNHRLIPGQWRQGACFQDIEVVAGEQGYTGCQETETAFKALL